MIAWTVTGAITQIGGTALLLAVMQQRSFLVTTAYVKTEPVQVAIFGVIFLSDQVTPGLAFAIFIATAGVLIISWPRSSSAGAFSWTAAGLGLASAALFAISAVGYRGSIRALETPSFLLGASAALVLGLIIQVVMLSAYLLAADRATLAAIARAWRPSLLAGCMGAFASQMWFLAFALETAAKVRTLARVEILFAQVVSHNLFKQSLASREAVGIVLISVGVVLLLNL
jgi:drug/metabolite transporter (DMT)-like permease